MSTRVFQQSEIGCTRFSSIEEQTAHNGATLKGDNATEHGPRVVRDVMQVQEINRKQFSARSLDLAPIEHL